MKKLIGIFLFLFLFSISLDALSSSFAFDKSNYGFVDLLWWQVRESGADNWAQIIPPAGSQRPIKIIDAPFAWNTGFRLGVGHQFEPYCYDIALIYTHYQTQATSQASGNVYSSFDANYFANNTDGASFGPNYEKANIRWQFFYNTLDFNVGHNFKIDSMLQLHPHIGLKSAIINQNIYSNWLNPLTATNFTSASENLKNNFWGIGPSIGADSTWPIFTRENQIISLIGNLDLDLLWGHWSFDDHYSNNAPVNISVNTDSVNGAAPVAIGLIGLQWQQHFSKVDMQVRVGYEAQVWFNQVQFYSLNMGRLNRPLWLQGGNFELRFNI